MVPSFGGHIAHSIVKKKLDCVVRLTITYCFQVSIGVPEPQGLLNIISDKTIIKLIAITCFSEVAPTKRGTLATLLADALEGCYMQKVKRDSVVRRDRFSQKAETEYLSHLAYSTLRAV